MRYQVYGLDAISQEPRKPLVIEADTEEAARQQAAAMGMAVHQVELARPDPDSPPPPRANARRRRVLVTSALALAVLFALPFIGWRLWKWATNREMFTLGNHPGDVYAVAYSPDGRTIVTATERTGRGDPGENVSPL